MSKIAKIFILIIITLTVGVMPVKAQSDSTKTVKVGYYESKNFMYGMSDDSMKYGYGYEYLQKIAYYTGWKYEYVYGTFDELYAMLLDGEIDILPGVMNKEEREELINFPERSMTTYGARQAYLCTAKDRTDLLEELDKAMADIYESNNAFTEELYKKYYDSSSVGEHLSESEREWVKSHDKMIIGYMDDYLPYCDTDEKGNATGVLTDVVKEILRIMGLENEIQVEYVKYSSHDDMIEALKEGSLDMVYPVDDNLWYLEQNDMSESLSIITLGTSLVYKGSYENDKTDIIAVNTNNKMQEYYTRRVYPDVQIILCDTVNDCLDAVNDGKAGSTIINALRADELLENSKYKALNSSLLFVSDSSCFGMRRGDSALLELINRGIGIIGSEYGLSASYTYAGSIYKYSFLDFIYDNFVFVIIGLVLMAAMIVLFFIRRADRLKKEADKDKKRREELTKALEDANAANKAKTDFLNNMSHDIRTPMNAIMGFTQLATENVDSQAKITEYLGKIETSGKHLLSLINDMLDMSRIESGKLKIEEEPCSLLGIMRDLYDVFWADALAKNLEFAVDTKSVVTDSINCDKLRLNQVLLNCISNAIKFSNRGGKVLVTVLEKESTAKEKADYVFTIEDNGIGMSKEFLEHIYEPFTREETSTVSKIQGTGLGMSICRHIVDMMGGEIIVESGKGKGTIITIKLSFTRNFNKENLANDFVPNENTDTDFTGKRVLLVEDNELNMEIAVELIRHTGADVDSAFNGKEALEKMTNSPENYYDLIFMDIQMPVMDGYEATGRIRSLPREDAAQIPIIAMTANAFEDARQNSVKAGMDGHTSKPIDLDVIVKIMKKYIK